MRPGDKWEEADKVALRRALMALGACPNCRADLQPVAYTADVWGCPKCRETWHKPATDR